MPIDDLTGIEIRATRLDLVVEEDSELTGVARLLTAPGTGAPTLAMRGSRLIISQEGRYRGASAPVLKFPATELPSIAANISRGDLTFENIFATLAIYIESGNLRVSGGQGDIAANVSSGDATILQREGQTACRIASGNLRITRCQGDMALNLSKGDVEIRESRGELALRLNKGDVSIIRPIEQSLRISSTKGDVHVQGGSLASANIDIVSGDISSSSRLLFTEPADAADELDDLDEFEEVIDEVVDVQDDEVHFNLGGVEFTAGEAGVRVKTGGTERFVAGPAGVEVRRADGTPLFSASDHGIRVGSEISGRTAEQFRFRTGRGSIMLDVSEDQPARVELIVNRGNVQSDIPLVEVGRPGPRSSTRRYVGVSDSSEADRILIRALTKRGDIQVRSTKQQSESQSAMGMSNRERQRRQILEALAQGRISAGEADILLAAMERESE